MSPPPSVIRTVVALTLAAVLLCSPSVTRAQEDPPGAEVYVSAAGGHFWTSDRLYGWNLTTDLTERSSLGEWGGVVLNSAPDGGLGMTGRFPDLGMDVTVAAERTIGLDGTLVAGSYCTEICLLVASPKHEYSFDVAIARLSVSADVRTLPSIWRVQPFITVGGGLKVYRFETRTIPDTLSVPLPQDDDVGMYRIGAGLSAPIDRVEIVLRATEFLSGYTSQNGTYNTEPQHDWSLSLGLRYQVW